MSSPLTEKQVKELLDGIELSRISEGIKIPLEYGGYSSQVLLRIHLLPYLLPIKSERQLAFAIAEKETLKLAVGLCEPTAPQRGTLWHFRKRNRKFRKLLSRALSVMYLDSRSRLSAELPFVKPEAVDIEGWDCDEFIDRRHDKEVRIFAPRLASAAQRERQACLPFPDISWAVIRSSGSSRQFLQDEIGFPLGVEFSSRVRADTQVNSRCKVFFHYPNWMADPYGPFEVAGHLGPMQTPYTACNVIVLGSSGSQGQVLLSRRESGAGRGTFTLPGGKVAPGETVKACARRELLEETGLILTSARPVSIWEGKEPGYPKVKSIGVLATAEGDPSRREWHQHSSWEWYDLSDLPSPLFFPTERVLRDFLDDKFPDLAWEEVEDPGHLPLWSKI